MGRRSFCRRRATCTCTCLAGYTLTWVSHRLTFCLWTCSHLRAGFRMITLYIWSQGSCDKIHLEPAGCAPPPPRPTGAALRCPHWTPRPQRGKRFPTRCALLPRAPGQPPPPHLLLLPAAQPTAVSATNHITHRARHQPHSSSPHPLAPPRPRRALAADLECLRPLDSLLGPVNATASGSSKPVAVVALMGDDLSFGHNVPNAFLAAAPGHPLWVEVLRAVQAAAADKGPGDWVEDVSGWLVFWGLGPGR